MISDVDECGNKVSPCAENAHCVNKQGTHQCICNERYTGDGEKSCTCKSFWTNAILKSKQNLYDNWQKQSISICGILCYCESGNTCTHCPCFIVLLIRGTFF